MKNTIFILDDVWEDTNLIKAEIKRNFGELINDRELKLYPENKEEHSEFLCKLEMFFGDETEKIGEAQRYFNEKFSGENILFIIDYLFNKITDGIQIFKTVIENKDFNRVLFHTAKGANDRDRIRQQINSCGERKIFLVRKPYFKDSSGKLAINPIVMEKENIIGLIREGLVTV